MTERHTIELDGIDVFTYDQDLFDETMTRSRADLYQSVKGQGVKGASRLKKDELAAIVADSRTYQRDIREEQRKADANFEAMIEKKAPLTHARVFGIEQAALAHAGLMAQEHRAKHHDVDGTCRLYGDECAVPGPGPAELAAWLTEGLVLTPPDEEDNRVFRFVEWRRGGAYVRNVATGQGRLVVQSEIVLWKHLPETNADQENEQADDYTVARGPRPLSTVFGYTPVSELRVRDRVAVLRWDTSKRRDELHIGHVTLIPDHIGVERAEMRACYVRLDSGITTYTNRIAGVLAPSEIDYGAMNGRLITERTELHQALDRLRERLAWLIGYHHNSPSVPRAALDEILKETR